MLFRSEDARIYGAVLSLAGLALLWWTSTPAAAALALTTLVTYVLIYTPMKARSAAATLVGAVPGALPPLIGWAAANGTTSAGGLALFAIVFLWQIPHFMAIAWMYRADYAAVGFPMLPVRDEAGGKVAIWSLLNTLALLVVSILPWWLGLATVPYLAASLLFGLYFLWKAIAFLQRDRRDVAARKLFFTSIAYLPLQLGVLVADRMINF